MPEISEVPQSDVAPKKDTASGSEIKKLNNPVDMLIVFGQGTVKPLLRSEELDPQMKENWEVFKKDPLHATEPDFRVLEGKWFLDQLIGLAEPQVQAKITEWQKLGRFGLNRWGRQNALSAGFALVSGYSERILLSGGKTISGWVKDKLPPERIEQWPSEAELMKDIIVRRFGKMYQKRYGKPIDLAITTEDMSTNTLENFANSLNSNEEILDGVRTGLLAADFHIPRTEHIAYLFAPDGNFARGDSAQQVLKTRIEGMNKKMYEEMLNWMVDPKNKDLAKRIQGEKRWNSGLTNPDIITYWLGYIGMVENPSVLQKTIQRLSSDPAWQEQAIRVFETAELNFQDLAETDLTKMSEQQFREIADKLKILSTRENRQMPEELNN